MHRCRVLVALTVLAVAVCACRRETRPPCVVVLGVDALHLPLLDALVADGKLPNFARLYREGTVGGVSTVQAGLPPYSPRIWTSFATGRLPADHGIGAFTHKDEKGEALPYSALEWRAPAFWEIASALGKRVGVVNWLATYPAAPVNGFMITGHYFVRPSMIAPRDPGSFLYPKELALPLAPLGLADQSSFMTVDNAERTDRDVLTAAFAAWERYPVDLLVIYTRALDAVSHLAWWTHEPLPSETPQFDIVVSYMRRYDYLLGQLLRRLEPRDHLVVLSDHGFERSLAPGGYTGTHTSAAVAVGVQIWWGPGVQAGLRRSSSLLDVAPTLLELLGIAPSADMPGQVLPYVFGSDHTVLARRPEPYPQLVRQDGGSGRSPVDAQVIDQLRALGYVE